MILEQKIQKQIIDYCHSLGYLVIKTIKTNMNGCPDLIILKDGVTIFCEVKRQGGVIAELQKYRQKQLTEQGFKSFFAFSLEDFKNKFAY